MTIKTYPKSVLAKIDATSVGEGFAVAVRRWLELPEVDPKKLKERAKWRVINDPASVSEGHFIARCWVKAYEDVLDPTDPVEIRFI